MLIETSSWYRKLALSFVELKRVRGLHVTCCVPYTTRSVPFVETLLSLEATLTLFGANPFLQDSAALLSMERLGVSYHCGGSPHEETLEVSLKRRLRTSNCKTPYLHLDWDGQKIAELSTAGDIVPPRVHVSRSGRTLRNLKRCVANKQLPCTVISVADLVALDPTDSRPSGRGLDLSVALKCAGWNPMDAWTFALVGVSSIPTEFQKQAGELGIQVLPVSSSATLKAFLKSIDIMIQVGILVCKKSDVTPCILECVASERNVKLCIDLTASGQVEATLDRNQIPYVSTQEGALRICERLTVISKTYVELARIRVVEANFDRLNYGALLCGLAEAVSLEEEDLKLHQLRCPRDSRTQNIIQQLKEPL